MVGMQPQFMQSRRDFLATGASGIGTLALASLLRDDGLLAAEASNPLAHKHRSTNF